MTSATSLFHPKCDFWIDEYIHKPNFRSHAALDFLYISLLTNLGRKTQTIFVLLVSPTGPNLWTSKLFDQYWPRTHLTHVISITIHIPWKFHFTITPSLVMISLQIFAHATTAQLSWHMQRFVGITSSSFGIKYFPRKQLWLQIMSVKWGPCPKHNVYGGPWSATDRSICTTRMREHFCHWILTGIKK